MPLSTLDQVYRSFVISKFFTKGWGKPENLKRIFEFRKIISDREKCKYLVSRDYPIHIEKGKVDGDVKILEGHFTSPLVEYLGDVLPKECHKAHFQLVVPRKWAHSDYRPLVIQLAGTGDHYFWRRRLTMARPLIKEAGVASIILENPFYGLRKPKEQVRSCLFNVSDIFLMGGCLVLECMALLHFCEREGYGPLGLTGISMGGHMASLAATNWPKPVALVPCMSWSSASVVFTQGVLSSSINWELLEDQYFSDTIYRDQLCKMIASPEKNSAFEAGRAFFRDLSTGEQPSTPYMPLPRDPASPHHSMPLPRDPAPPHHSMPSLSQNMNPSVIKRNSQEYKSWKRLLNKINFTESLALSKSRIMSTRNEEISTPKKSESQKRVPIEALNFMRGIMDECTHLANFSMPVDPRLAIIVCARYDDYYPREGLRALTDIWPGAEIRYIESGHISGFLFYQSVFRTAIVDALERLVKEYYGEQIAFRKLATRTS